MCVSAQVYTTNLRPLSIFIKPKATCPFKVICQPPTYFRRFIQYPGRITSLHPDFKTSEPQDSLVACIQSLTLDVKPSTPDQHAFIVINTQTYITQPFSHPLEEDEGIQIHLNHVSPLARYVCHPSYFGRTLAICLSPLYDVLLSTTYICICQRMLLEVHQTEAFRWLSVLGRLRMNYFNVLSCEESLMECFNVWLLTCFTSTR